jgi:hypothetical protein
MNPPSPRLLVLTSVLALAAMALAFVSTLPPVLGVAIALVGVALSLGLELRAGEGTRALDPLPAMVALGILAAACPLGSVPELVAGGAGVAVIAWLAEAPDRPPHGAGRGALGWGLPGLAVGVAWIGSLLLPPSAAPIGVAGGLLAAAVLALAYLFRRPELAVGAAAPSI